MTALRKNRRSSTPRRGAARHRSVQHRSGPRRIPYLAIFAALACIGMLVFLGATVWLGLFWVRVHSSPHHEMVSEYGYPPLLSETTEFDVGVSVFAVRLPNATVYPECSYKTRGVWERTARRTHLFSGWHPPCDVHRVPDTEELWSGIIARNLTLASRGVDADIEFDIPTEYL